jgi:hypothetical protein
MRASRSFLALSHLLSVSLAHPPVMQRSLACVCNFYSETMHYEGLLNMFYMKARLHHIHDYYETTYSHAVTLVPVLSLVHTPAAMNG